MSLQELLMDINLFVEEITIEIIARVIYASTFLIHHSWHKPILLVGVIYFFYKKNMIRLTCFLLLWLFFNSISPYCVHFYLYPMYPMISGIKEATQFMLYGDFDFKSLAIQVIENPPVLKKFVVVVACIFMVNHFFILILFIGVIKLIIDKDYENLLLFLVSWFLITTIFVNLTLAFDPFSV